MKLFDQHFRTHALRYVTQCLLAMLAILIVLAILNAVLNTTIIAALGASTFIAFTMPHKPNSQPRYLIGGYVMGTIAGVFSNFMALLPLWAGTHFITDYGHIIFGALAVGLAIFLMVVTDTEHPPAAGLALGYVLNECTFLTVVVVILGILCLVGIKTALKSQLIDL